jgi:branched-chain amino acid transport system permease protein
MTRALLTPRGAFVTIVLALCALMPFLAPAVGEPYYVDVFGRTMIWAIAAVSLNLILGYGGMVSFGHAMFLGIGSYTVGILAYHEVNSGFIQWPLALLFSGLAALVVGAICLRTRGLYFIMITLAFAQMFYYLAVSAEEYGSDDGLLIDDRSEFKIVLGDSLTLELDLSDRLTLYYLIFAFLLLSLYITHRIIHSRFGMVLQGTKSNEARMRAIGYRTYRYKLAAFVIAGVMCGMAGILTANFERYISPDMMYWTHSGELIFMVVLGGMGSVFGPVTGAIVFIVLTEMMSNVTEHWHLAFGPLLILAVLFARRGIDGLFGRREGGDG